MKNISLRFTLVAFALVLAGGVIRDTSTPVALALLLSPLGMVTMLLSIKLHQTVAHVLNMIPAVIWLALPVVYLIGKDTGDLAFIILVFVFGPILLGCMVVMWILAWTVRGEEEIAEEDFHLHGRDWQLVLPNRSRKPSNPPNR